MIFLYFFLSTFFFIYNYIVCIFRSIINYSDCKGTRYIDFHLTARIHADFLRDRNLSRFRVPRMLNPLLIGGISRGPTVDLAAPSSRADPYTPHGAPVRTLYTLFCLREIPADSYSLERNKRYLFPSSLSLLSLSLFLFLLVSRKRIARSGSGEVPATWPTTPLRSLRSRTSYRGFSFYASHFLLSANFVFLSCPSPAPSVHASPRGSSVASFFLFPFSCCSTPGPSHGGLCNT